MNPDAACAHVPLVVATRGETVENIHFGSVAVVDAAGRVLHSAGDPQATTFPRSALKPFQALPLLREEGDRALGLDDREVTLLTASHSGEEFHVLAVDSILAKSRQHWRRLKCGCHVPYVFETLGRTPPPRATFDPRYHNCSGKHAGFLAYCQLHNLPTDTYLDFDHPLQVKIKQAIADLLELPLSAIPTGIDGCSAPNHALPLAGLGRLWAMLATGRSGTTGAAGAIGVAGAGAGAAGAGHGQADPVLERLFGLMTAHPEYVSGTGRSDLHFMRAGGGDWVAKVGADGVQAIGIRSRGLGIAIKISDGNSNARFVAAFEVLRRLGLVQPDHPELGRYHRIPIDNAAGLRTGEMRPVFDLRAH